MREKNHKILIGDKFGLLTVISFKGIVNNNMMIECVCECGNTKIISRPSLRQNRTKSCGCLSKKLLSLRSSNNSYRKLEGNEAAKNALYSSYRGWAVKRKYEWSISKEKFIILTSENCYYCNSVPANTQRNQYVEDANYIYNGIDRFDNSKGYTEDNCVSCCKLCNFMKNNLSVDEFKSHIKKIINNMGNKCQ